MKRIFTLILVLCAFNSLAQNIGELNTDFGTEGSYIFEPSTAHDFLEKILIQDDGKILTVGKARVDGSKYSIYVSRHNADGTLDVSYRDGGLAYFKATPNIYMNCAFDAELNDDGLLFVTGYTFDYSNNSAFILCLDENGFEYTDFGDNGVLYINAGEYAEYATTIGVQADGKYLVGGHDDLLTYAPYPRCESYITRVNTDGTIDETFGNDGFVKIEQFSGDGCTNECYSVMAAPDGQIFGTVYSYNHNSLATRAYVYNLDDNGQFKENFAGTGIMVLPQIENEELKITTSSLALQNDSNLLVGGYIASDNYSNQKLFMSCVNVDIENGEDIGELTTSLLLYPNPVKDQLHIATESIVGDIAVYDVYGRLQDYKTTRLQDVINVNVSNLHSGVYFVMIKSDNKTLIEKFIKQ